MKRRIMDESPLPQGEDEEISYEVDTRTNGGSLDNPPTEPAVELKILGTLEDVSDEHLVGDPVVDGYFVYTPLVVGLEAGVRYRLETRYKIGVNTFEPWCELRGQV
jgi:hypothetical protein